MYISYYWIGCTLLTNVILLYLASILLNISIDKNFYFIFYNKCVSYYQVRITLEHVWYVKEANRKKGYPNEQVSNLLWDRGLRGAFIEKTPKVCRVLTVHAITCQETTNATTLKKWGPKMFLFHLLQLRNQISVLHSTMSI